MKKSTGTKSKPKFAKKRANSKQPDKKSDAKYKPTNPHAKDDTRIPGAKPGAELSERDVKVKTTPPPADAPPEVRIGGPTPEVRPCSPAETQKGHHEVIQS